jgi:Fe-S oxidoreductase
VTDADLSHWSELNYYACTVCNRCSMVCPMGIDLGSLLFNMRSGLSAAGVVPDDLMAAVNKQVEEGSPLGMTASVWDDRLEWVADEWEVEIPRDVKGADTLVVFSSIEPKSLTGPVKNGPSAARRARSSTSVSTRAARSTPNYS